MVFLNLILAGGLVAVSAPIIIHLLHRSRVVPHDWGAMMFLEELLAERARRLRMQEIILLLVRALIVGCLALALMRPALQSRTAGVRAKDVRTSAVLLLDDSYSMNAGRGRSGWTEAKDEALKYINTLQRGDDVAVMFTSSAGKAPTAAALYDLEHAKDIVQQAKVQHDKADLPRALGAALQQLECQHNPRRELVLLTDMQAAGWDLGDGARWSFLANTVRSSRVKPSIVIAGTPDARPNNIALLGLEPSRQVVDCFSTVAFNVTVANTGPEPLKDASVSFSVDNAPKATRTVTLAPGAREVVQFEHKFDRPGSHYISCKARSMLDALDDDNDLYYSVVVIDRLPVLVIDGDRKERALGSETDFLRMALSPRDNDDPQWRTVIETTIIAPTDLRYTDLSKFRVIALANVAALPATAVSDIERFVVAGGGLMIALGDRVQAAVYNRDLFRQGAGLLPVPLKSITKIAEAPSTAAPRLVASEVEKKASPAVHLASINSKVPALDLFRPEKGQDWSKARIRAHYSTSAPGENVRVLATYSNGEAALVQKQLGEGKVLLLTTAVDLDWSDLPIHPFYVPLMQNLVFDLASAVIPPRNLPVGQTLAHAVTGSAALKPHVMYPPNDEPAVMRMQRQGQLSIFTQETTRVPGLYTVLAEGAPPEERVFYTVTADRSESELGHLSPADCQRLERDMGARFAPDWSALARLIQLDAGGYEISAFLIFAALALCFVEIYLTRRWA
ncbi:MAG TPA: BatA domain-containing protein [Planctomycetota bacterium]|jgi:hypothetical protein